MIDDVFHTVRSSEVSRQLLVQVRGTEIEKKIITLFRTTTEEIMKRGSK